MKREQIHAKEGERVQIGICEWEIKSKRELQSKKAAEAGSEALNTQGNREVGWAN